MEFSCYGYLDTLEGLPKHTAEKALKRMVIFNGERMTRADFIVLIIRSGGRLSHVTNIYRKKGVPPGEEYRLFVGEGTEYFAITKAEYLLGQYLREHGQTKEAQDRLRDAGQQHEAAALFSVKDEQARRNEEKLARVAFARWLFAQSKTDAYMNDPRFAVLDQAFMKHFDIHPRRHLLVLIDNMDNPRSIEVLKGYLHPRNPASREAFTKITGITLPHGMRRTHALLDTLASERVKQPIGGSLL